MTDKVSVSPKIKEIICTYRLFGYDLRSVIFYDLLLLYILIVPLFRGCANATFAHDQRCSRELQAVQIIWGKQSVDVEIKLCFCNGEKCNESANGAMETLGIRNNSVIFFAMFIIYWSTLTITTSS